LKKLILIIFFFQILVCCKQAAQPDASDSPITSNLSTFSSYEVVSMAERNTAIRAKAVVTSLDKYTMVSNDNSIIQKKYFSVGAAVPKGALIMTLDNAEELLALKKTKVELEKAKYEYSETLLLKDSVFYNGNGNWDQVKARTAYDIGFPQAEVAHQQAQLALKRKQYYAPFTGVLAGVWKGSGEIVKAGERMGFLYNPTKLVAMLELIEYDYHQIQVGDKALMTTMSDESQQYFGEVLAKDAAINSNGFFSVQISFKEAKELVPGINLSVTIYTKPIQGLAVPAKAMVNKSGKDVVFTYQSGLAKWNYVTKGATFDDSIEIVDGLQPGDTVLTTDVFQLAHDSEVVLAKPMP